MKYLFVVISIILPSLVFAASCPNISGEFLSGEKDLLKIEQTDCSVVTFRFGIINFMGHKTYKPGYLQYSIGGEPLCRMPSGELCTSVSVQGDLLTFETDYNGAIDGGLHGVCAYRAVSRKLDSQNNLVNIYEAFDCTDGSQTKIEKTFNKTLE